MVGEEQAQVKAQAATVEESTGGDRWGDDISAERQEELKALADRQREWTALPKADRGDSHFKGVRLTGADACWLAAYALTSPEGDVAAVQGQLRAARDDVESRYSPDLSCLHLEGADLFEAHLERADLREVHLERADLRRAHLEGAHLRGVHLEQATINGASVEGDNLTGAHLEGADLRAAHMKRARLRAAYMEAAILYGTHLEEASLYGVQLEGADLRAAHLEGADLREARLEGADLGGAHLEAADLGWAHLESKIYVPGDTDLKRIQQWAKDFPATVPPADLRLTFLTAATTLNNLQLGDAKGGAVRLADVRWGGVNLAVVDWTPFTDGKAVLGDEQAARDWKAKPFTETEEQQNLARQERARARAEHVTSQDQTRLEVFQAAVRANRQVATALRDQGMNEEADYFAYRAQVLQRAVFRHQRKRIRATFSWFLDALAGHGYKPERSLFAYLIAIFGFGIAYYFIGRAVGPHLSPLGAFVFSMTSFHGRGFFPGGIQLDDPITVLAALEAFMGLVIEVSFIATFTQRFFAR